MRDRFPTLSGGNTADLRESANVLLENLETAVNLKPVRAYRREVAGLSSSYDAPTEAERLEMGRLAELVDALESEINIFLVGDVAHFREKGLGADLEGFSLPRLVGN